jgi:hypothetical protein
MLPCGWDSKTDGSARCVKFGRADSDDGARRAGRLGPEKPFMPASNVRGLELSARCGGEPDFRLERRRALPCWLRPRQLWWRRRGAVQDRRRAGNLYASRGARPPSVGAGHTGAQRPSAVRGSPETGSVRGMLYTWGAPSCPSVEDAGAGAHAESGLECRRELPCWLRPRQLWWRRWALFKDRPRRGNLYASTGQLHERRCRAYRRAASIRSPD